MQTIFLRSCSYGSRRIMAYTCRACNTLQYDRHMSMLRLFFWYYYCCRPQVLRPCSPLSIAHSYLAFRVVSRCDVLLARCGGGFPGGGGGRAGSGSLPLSCSRLERTHVLPSPSARGIASPILAAGRSWPASSLLSTREGVSRRLLPRSDDAATMPVDPQVGLESPLAVGLIRETASAFVLSPAARGEGDSTALRLFECLLGST